jgi:hypothetical protein
VPTDDPRLEAALHDAAPVVGTAGVADRVAHHRRRRRRNRRIVAGALALVVALVLGTVVVATRGDGGRSPHVAAPGAGFHARVVDGDAAVANDAGRVVAPKRVTLDAKTQALRPPMLVGATALSTASYDPGIEGIAPSHVVRVDGNHVVDITDFKARILSLAEGEGARWVVTQNHGLTGGTVPDAFLKRIAANGDTTTVQLPRNADPVGSVAAVGGAVWVPVRDGVLEFDTSGRFVRQVALPDADARSVAQVGKVAYVTDGTMLRGLDASGATTQTLTYGPEILGLAGAGFDSRALLRGENGGDEGARVVDATSSAPVLIAMLPDGFHVTGLAASTDRFWATGTVDGAPAIVLLDGNRVRATVVLENAGDEAALVWTGPHAVRAVAGGALYDIALP